MIWNQEREKAGLDQKGESEDVTLSVKLAVEAVKGAHPPGPGWEGRA